MPGLTARNAAKEAVAKLKELQDSFDPEGAHGEADGALCDLIEALGFPEVVEEYHKIHKWYA